jgi:hypothetical protein
VRELAVRHGRPARKAGVWLRQASAENVLFDPDTQSAHLVNHTALAIWDLCDGDTDPGEMIEAICAVSGMPEEVVAEDVRRTLESFERAGLITWMEH